MNINKTLGRYLKEEDMSFDQPKEEKKFPDLTLGRHNDTEKDVDPTQLQMGIRIEQEHVPDGIDEDLGNEMAKRIALDHLAECPDYYTRLAKMETECKEKDNGPQEED